jgi:bifunctional DNA-binding transcriptional regulator/antitoxin component of YhaV-PrlF toxin-antitoxin module
VADIEVASSGDGFAVRVADPSGQTTHQVGTPDDYLRRLGLHEADRSEVVRASFEFLLEREPKESIMRSFELPVIERYFPEYPDEIRRRLGVS